MSQMTFGSLAAPWAMIVYSIDNESPGQRPIARYLWKSVTAILGYFVSTQIYVVLI